MKKWILLLAILPVLAAACTTPQPVTTATVIPSPSHMLSPTPEPTSTPLLPAASVTSRPVEGTLTIKVNVRSGPGTSYPSLGLLNAGENVQIMVQDSTGKWYQILFPPAPGGSGWLAAQFVQVAGGIEVPLQPTPTPAGPSGRVIQRLNVRSGPGLFFEALGMLEPNAVVALTGKNATASWLQIDFPAGNSGHGWVTAQYIQTNATDLPVLDDYGTPVANTTGGPTPFPFTPTSTVGPAFNDADSAAKPAVRVTFSIAGTRQFTYSSQVSAPQGDSEDWVAFTPFAINSTGARLAFSLACSGNATLTVELWREGSPLSGWGTLACGNPDGLLALPADQEYELCLAPAPGAGLRLVDYILTLRNLP
jgi:uncharacterized protein YraI